MNIPSAYRIQDYAEAAAWLLFCGLLAHAIWERSRNDNDDRDQPDWATLNECDLQALGDGDAQTIQTGSGDLYRLEAVDMDTSDDA
ncbi:hypothetical protein [Haloarcula argentinensis]|uniref:Uncharacterized protein n=1 Tax=Haloarcula argentinensis TaxID=43776 RepID=A0A847UQJ9_HALAR|nr:hypothetical protein [Haloarcula argentinensis]NLV14414.1 hypothetical protein [Haloarcula argentinensis]